MMLAGAQNPKAGKHLVFDQDFSKVSSIDTKVWHFDDGPVYNLEKETYCSGPGEFAKISGGELVITAKRIGSKIMSTRITSLKSWKYGYFEAEAKVPVGKGTWPAFWMLNERLRSDRTNRVGWPRCGEIDIMENKGSKPEDYQFSLHCQDFNWMKPQQRTVIKQSRPGYHKFGLLWSADSITFYLDGKSVKTFSKTPGKDTFDDWPFRDPFYFIVNLAIGGNYGGEIDESIFPAEYRLKYVRVWQ